MTPSLTLSLALLTAAASGFAPPAPAGIDEAPPEGVWLSAAAGLGTVDGDVDMAASFGVGLETRPFAVHLSVPVTLRLFDVSPPSSTRADAPACAVIRCEEWLAGGALSPNAVARIVDELRILHPGALFYARGGTVSATLGHGQLVDEYTNAADWDRRRSGLYAESNLPWGRTQIQALAGSLLAPQELFGARVSTSPLAPTHEDADSFARFLGRMRLGLEAAGDATAPAGDAIDARGDLLRTARTRAIGGVAADLSWPLLDDGGALQVAPWIGGSALFGLERAGTAGAGGAFGLDATFDAAVVAVHAGARVSADGPGHRSAVFSTLYDVDRRRYARAPGSATFAREGVADLAAPGGAGGGGELDVVVLRLVRAGVRVHVDPVPEATRASLFTEVGAGAVRVAVRAEQRAIGANGAVVLGDRTFVIAEAAWAFFPPVSLTARWLHGPRFDPAHGGDPRADDDVIVGASLDLVLAPAGT